MDIAAPALKGLSMPYYVRHHANGKTGQWFPISQRKWQRLERACGFYAPEGEDATAGFSGTSEKSGLKWEGVTFNPYEETK